MVTELQKEAIDFNWLRFQLSSGRAALNELIKLKEYIDEETYQDLYQQLSDAFWIIRHVRDQVQEVQEARIRTRKFHTKKYS